MPQTDTRISAARRLLAAAAVLAAALLIAACGDSGDNTTTVTAAQAAEAQPVETTSTTSTTEAAAPTGTTPTTADDSSADATSDAAGAVPDDQSAVDGGASAADEATTPSEADSAVTSTTGTTTAPETSTTPTTSTTETTTPTTSTTETTPPTDISGTALPPTTATTPTITPTITPSITSGSTGAVLSRPFSTTSPWNQDVSNDPVDPQSHALMRRAQKRLATVEQPNGKIKTDKRTIDVGLTVNVTRWTVPVFSDNQPGAVPRVTVCRQLTCGEDATTSIVIPEDACPDPRYDGWMTVLDTSARTAYDYWRARCEADGSLSYHYVKAWALDGPGFQDPTGVSARGSGLPLFAGLITPEEVDSGRIEHALAISVPGAAQRRYVQPASRTDGTGALNSVPEGARLRLRPGSEKRLTKTFVKNGTERETARTIIAALERYGAIIVDRSAAPTMYAQRNANWDGVLPLNLLQDIPLSKFDVVDLPKIFFDPPKGGEAEAVPPGTPGSVPGTSSGSQGDTGATDFGQPNTDFGQVVTP